MRKHVDQLAERIAHIEPPHAPRLVSRAVLDRNPGRKHACECVIDVVDLDRQIGVGVPDPPSDAKLICTSICSALP